MDSLLRLLAIHGGQRRTDLCRALGITAQALETRLAALRAEGYVLDAEAEHIALRPQADVLLPGYVLLGLHAAHYGRGEMLYAPEMDSTNTQLKQAAMARALPDGSLAFCGRQTAGRGRMQRVWEDPQAGQSLTCSLLLRPTLPQERLHLITLAAALAAAQALMDAGADARIKWPNDVVIAGRKCVGILSELVLDPVGAPCIVTGTGFNVNQTVFAHELADKATSLRLSMGRPADRVRLLQVYLEHMEHAVATLEAGGLPALLPAYRARSVTLDARVQVIGAAETFVGVAEAMDEEGALLVRCEDGALRRVLSGDVSVRGVMGYV